MRRYTFVAGALAVLCAFGTWAGGSEQEAVLTGTAAHCEKVSGMEVRSASTAFSPAGEEASTWTALDRMEFGPMKGGPIDRFYTEIGLFQDFREMDLTTKEVHTVKKTKKTINAFDGKNSASFDAWVKEDSSLDSMSGRLLADGQSIFPYGGTWVEAVMPIGSYPLEWLLDGAEVSGPIDWKGRKVYVIGCSYGPKAKELGKKNFTFYVDPERDFAKCYSELRDPDGKIVETIEMSDFTEIDGLWLPSSYQVRHWWEGIEKPSLTKTTLEYIRVNPQFEPADFHIKWPRGTYIFDETIGVEYYAMGGSSAASTQAAQLEELLAEVADSEEEIPPESPREEPSADTARREVHDQPQPGGGFLSQRGVLVLLFGICLLLGAVTVLALVWTRRRRRRKT